VSYAGQTIYSNLYLPGWGPTNGYFIMTARTGGLTEETHLASVSIDTTLYSTPVAPTVTSQPQSVTVNEGNSASFSVTVDGTGPFAYQWTKNGGDIQDATNRTVTLPAVFYADNKASIAVRITNPATTITSSPATLTVIRDTTQPAVTNAAADMTFTSIFITYSKPVSDTALSRANYAINQAVSISTINRLSQQTVQLITSQLTQGQIYTVTINGVQDIDTIPNTIAPNTQVQVRSFVFLGGSVLHKKYNNVSDNNGWPLSNLFTDPRYPNAPDRQDILSAFEYPPGGNGRVAADPNRDYFDSVEGYFIPPTTTNYVFFTAGADRWSLYLSTDESAASINQIANANGWTNPRGWNTGQGSPPTDMTGARSDTYAATAWPYGNTITLTNGQRYYMLLIHHDPSWSGADDFAATYTFQGENVPSAGDAPKLTGSVVGFYFDPTGASITFNQQPQNAIAVQGTAASFSVAATGNSVYGTNILYQWQSAPKAGTTWTNIPGAIGTSFTTSLLGLTDDSTQYRVIATVAPITATSAVATVTVTVDTNAPIASAGAMLDAIAATVDIGVGFNKPMDNTSISQMANYSVSPGTIASLTVYTNRFTADSQNPLARVVHQSVLLKVIGLSGSGTVTVQNVTDAYGNKLISQTIPVSVSANMHWGVVGANELGYINAVVPVAANGFDVYSDGTAEWGNYDEATLVYEQVSGDFDKKLRVVYQDGSSQWARAGLVVRDVTNFGVDRNGQTTNNLAGRYQKCHVNPVGATLTGPDNLGNALWEGNRRLDTGGATSTALAGVNSTPQYPNAWCRIQRTNQTFTIYRSDDGVNWVALGSTTWGVDDASKTPMPNTVYVGPEFSPENGNIAVPDQGTFLAQIRDYGNYTAVFDPQLKIQAAPGKATITWTTGTLVSSPGAQGPYTPVTGATSPYVVTPSSAGATFYRVMQ
jgi:hypothetical protein